MRLFLDRIITTWWHGMLRKRLQSSDFLSPFTETQCTYRKAPKSWVYVTCSLHFYIMNTRLHPHYSDQENTFRTLEEFQSPPWLSQTTIKKTPKTKLYCHSVLAFFILNIARYVFFFFFFGMLLLYSMWFLEAFYELLCVIGGYSFSFLCSISLYEYATIYLSFLLLMDFWLFYIGIITRNMSVSILCMSFVNIWTYFYWVYT